MKLTKEYLEEQEKCIEDNYNTHRFWEDHTVIKERYLALKGFCKGAKAILSVGSGGVEPVVIGATHALDVSDLTGNYLKGQGWKGEFKLGSCDDLCYPAEYFDIAVCSEVIEHLPDMESVKKTFQELDRVALRWVVTTPAIKINDPGHKRVFNFKMLLAATLGLKCKIIKRGRYWWISND